MLLLVFTFLLLTEGILGVSSSDTSNNMSAKGRTFDSFQESSWNPVNWFSNDSDDEKSEKQLTALYKTIECLTKNDPKDCAKFVEDARIYFEKDKNMQKKKKGDMAANATNATNATNANNTS